MMVVRVAALLLAFVPLAGARAGNAELVGHARKEGRIIWCTTLSLPESKRFAELVGESS